MRRFTPLFVCALLLVPASISALVARPVASVPVSVPALFPASCPQGASTGDPTETKVFVDGVTTPEPVKDFMARKVMCPSACYNVRVSISRTQVNGKEGMQFKVTGTSACGDATKLPKDQTPPRGCQVGQTQPTITVDVPKISYSIPLFGEQILLAGQTVGPKSRCNATGVLSTVNAVFTKLDSRDPGTIKTAQADIDAIKNTPNTATPLPNTEEKPLPSQPTPVDGGVAPGPNVPTDEQALAKLLTDKYKVPEEQAKTLVETQPDKVKEMIQKSITNDTAGAQELAKQLNLNEDTMKSIAQMTPPEQLTPEQAAELAKRQDAPNTNTFDPNAKTGGIATQCGTEGLAGNIMFAESKCGRINSNPLSSVQGPYHFLCSTWQGYANSTGNGQYANCAYRNDPVISTQVMNAKMEQFGNQYGARCADAGLTLSSCQYGIHVLGETGFKNTLNAYLNNPSAPASSLRGTALGYDAYDNNESLFRKGGTVAGVFGEFDRRLGGNSTQIGGIQQVQSPITGFFGGGGSVTNSGSPFGGAGLFNLGNYSSSVTGYSTPTGYSTGTGGSLGSFFTGLFSGMTSVSQNTTPVTQNQVQYPVQGQPQAVVSIIAQPQAAYVGTHVVVSWSSVGMRADRPCVTQMISKTATSTIANQNEGSTVVTATEKGLIRFAISCNAQSGQTVMQTTTLTVR